MKTTKSIGKRVVVYQSPNGSIKKACSNVEVIIGADHSNEKPIRSYSWREFGGPKDKLRRFIEKLGIKSARSIEIAFYGTGLNVKSSAFTLDDGTTTIVKGTDLKT